MKKRVFTVLLTAAMAISLAAYAGMAGNGAGKRTEETPVGQSVSKGAVKSEAAPEETPGENAPEQAASDERISGGNVPERSVVKWSCGTSGNVLLTVAEEKGCLKDEGITVEYAEVDANANAMTLLATGKVDIVSNAGTSNPLQQIASGVGLTASGGHMVKGCMSVVAGAGAEWNGIEPFIGKKVVVNPSYFAFAGTAMDSGYDNPLEAVDWEIYSSCNGALAAVTRGDAEYVLMGTGQNLVVQEIAKNGEIDIVSYRSEIMEDCSCCRVEGRTQWIKDNSNTVKAVVRASLRAQSYYESSEEGAIKLHAAKIKATGEYVAAHMLDNEHYFVSIDLLKNSVKRARDILGKTGLLDKKAKEINIDGHINIKSYEEVLGGAAKTYGGEAPEFYQNMKTFFEENDK